jgi:hypothetical protein
MQKNRTDWWRRGMYFKDNKQISLYNFGEKAGLKLDPKNRWIRMSELINWDDLEEEYSCKYCGNNGAPAKPIRLALGALLIKQIESLSDEKVVRHIQENPYMQYFCGIKEFSYDQPFAPSLMVEFRKRFDDEAIWNINEDMFRSKPAENEKDDDNDKPSPPNQGALILDATCAPADIKYPQDINLCNEAREKTEQMVEAMHAGNCGKKPKPRLDKEKARKFYLKVAKSKKRSGNVLRKAIKKQLSYIRRNLNYVDRLIADGHYELLSEKQKTELDTIRKLYDQQKQMIDTRTNSVPDRIVSISQPHVRPIVRGKAAAKTEFGAKVAISVVDGYAFVDNISWDPYNEGGDLIEVAEYYKAAYGFYPEAIMADKIYRNRDNLEFCKSNGIRLSGPKLGRPRRDETVSEKLQAYKDSGVRNMVEAKFGIGKIAYGLRRVMAKLKDTSETVICLAFLAMNLVRKLAFYFVVFRRFLLLWVFEYPLYITAAIYTFRPLKIPEFLSDLT